MGHHRKRHHPGDHQEVALSRNTEVAISSRNSKRKSGRGRSNPVDKESVGDGNVEGRRAADDLDDGLHHQTRKGVDSKNQRVLGVQDPERKMV